MRSLFVYLLFFTLIFSCRESAENSQEIISKPKLSEEAEFFWENLNELCGFSYAGKNIDSPTNDSSFLGKQLIMHFIKCDSNRVEAAFHVDNNRSRMLQISNMGSYLELKHQHTTKDGLLSEDNYYGGESINQGLYNAQFFPANQYTAEMIPAAAGNIWWLELEPNENFTYHLYRVGTDRRFSFEFDLAKPIENPVSPWGWKD